MPATLRRRTNRGSGIHLETRRNRSLLQFADDTYPIGKVRLPKEPRGCRPSQAASVVPAFLLVGELRFAKRTDQKSGGWTRRTQSDGSRTAPRTVILTALRPRASPRV